MSLRSPYQVGNIPWRNNNFSLTSRDPPLSDQGETIIGVYLLVLGWLSWFGNSLVIFVLYKQRASLQPTDYLTFNLAVSDASISVFGYSRGIIEIFNVFKDNGYLISSVWTCQFLCSAHGSERRHLAIAECFTVATSKDCLSSVCHYRVRLAQVDGFFTLIFGLSSINTLTIISVTRYIKGCHPSKAHHITSTTMAVCLLLIWCGAVFWSGSPLLGWGSYTDRGYGTCEVDWSKASYSTVHKSYIVSILVFCFLVPVLIMLSCYVSIINTVKRGNAMSAEGDLTERQRKMERDVTIVSVVVCTAFILAWSPYAVVSAWSAWGFHVPSLTGIFTSLFAKSASFYNPLIYFGLSSKFRKDVAALLPCARDGRDAVKLKHFRPNGDAAHGPQRQGAAKPRHNQTERKYVAGRSASRPVPSPDSGVGRSPPGTPPPVNKEVFCIEPPQTSEGPEFECVRL